MSLHTFKFTTMAGRAAAFVTAVGFMGALTTMALPGLAAADPLNPLTERSLMLSSSSPGWAYTDGSGNSTYAPPGSGANGQKTGETFSFKVSTDSTSSPTIKGFSLQYCTSPAGQCTAPGNVGTADPDNEESALNVHYTTPVEDTDFNIYVGGPELADATEDSGWSMEVSRVVDLAGNNTTGNNMIHLYKASGMNPASGTKIWIVLKATASNYITNPGSGAFFVKINDYDTDDPDLMLPTDDTHIIDGGVTVANVMNESIHITTKVLETMAFSVGTVNPDTVDPSPGSHGPCDAITTNNQIQMGDQNAEFSLSPFTAYDASSYWRLSTNSSAGATVYYSGETLNNTVGDDIDPIGASKAPSQAGQEQFGLAIDDRVETLDGAAPANHLTPLVAASDYDGGGDPDINDSTPANNAEFAFTDASNTSPVAIASNNTGVLECATAKMRYVANIAPFTPAGVYTTKINYIAAPRY